MHILKQQLISRSFYLFVAIIATACSGAIELRYGETICDPQHPCAEGFACERGICVASAGGDSIIASVNLGDWSPGDDARFRGDSGSFCRVDAQCGPNSVCKSGFCVNDPCDGVVCASNDICRPRCRTTATACDGVSCTDNAEHCLGGVCQPLCFLDPCTEGTGCIGGPNCVDGSCVGATYCQLGACEPTVVFPCGDDFCAPGFECLTECGPTDPCNPNPCNSGWRCAELGNGDYNCIEIACSGITCSAGEVCIGGNCVDPCINVDCALGGQAGCGDDQVCCGRSCCPDYFLCRQGECIAPEVNCEPACETDETCLPNGCFCGPIDQLASCGAQQCCLDDACDNPCAPNPCASEETDRGCEIDCDVTEGYACTNLCTGITCEAPETCNFDTGMCSCGGSDCTTAQCCLAGVCDDPCAGNPCGATGACVPNCEVDPYYTCEDRCADVTCDIETPQCDPTTGICACGGSQCGSADCCLADSCDNPCDPDPCGGLQCSRDCGNTAQPYKCVDACGDVTCNDPANPDCDPGDGSCSCNLNDTCTGNECCVSGLCDDACSGAPCQSAPNYRCTKDCTSTTGHTCSNPCDPDPCVGDLRNPNCDPSNDGQCICSASDAPCSNVECCVSDACLDPCASSPCAGLGLCVPDCSAGPLYYSCINQCLGVNCSKPNTSCDPEDGICKCDGATCFQNNRCCIDDGINPLTCENPCFPNPCPDTNRFDPNWLKCNRNCADASDLGFACSDHCASVTCNKPNMQCDAADGNCKCGGVGCAGSSTCCIDSGGGPSCESPCSPNPCGGLECIVDCNDPSGYTCQDNCQPTDPCTNNDRNPDCNPATGSCTCNVSDVCNGNECCMGSACGNPCAGDPCGGLECIIDCAQTNGRRCVDNCQPTDPCSGNARNPNCDPSDGSCTCGISDTCTSSECCVGSTCQDPCAGNPCGTTGRCVPNCGGAQPYTCIDECIGNTCEQPNPNCNSVNGNCICEAPNTSCGGSQCCIGDSCTDPCAPNPCTTAPNLRCTADCSQPQGYTCDDACSPSDPCASNSFNPDCNHETAACGCGTGTSFDTCSAPNQVCCDDGSGGANCASNLCLTSCGANEGCDPCSGCYCLLETCP